MKLNWWRQLLDLKSIEAIEAIELNRKALILYAMSYIGSFVTYYFACVAHSEDPFLFRILFGCATVFFVNALLSHFWTSQRFASYIMCIGISVLLVGLAYTGGYNGTALYWMFPIPIVFFTLLNYKFGLIFNSLLFSIIFVVINNPQLNISNYDPATNLRFEVALALTILFAFISELVRSQSQKNLMTLSIERQQLAHTDQLTGLPNRHYLAQLDFSSQKDNANVAKFPLAVVMADIDYFKAVNDQYGHDVGDNVLKYLAQFFKRSIRSSDMVIRMGGEEFLMLFPATEAEIAINICDKLNSHLAISPYQQDKIEIAIGLSFGVALVTSWEELEQGIKQADQLLYLAKDNGRGRAESNICALKK